jgi:hypothetical protein
MLELIVNPTEPPLTWEEMVKKYGAYSIAIDGFVKEGPRKDLKIPAINLNHHEGVPRYDTLATCQQALDKVREGLMRKHFIRDGKPHAKVLTNDCDEDVCTTWAILNNAWRFESSANPKINRLVDVEGRLDRTAGAYAFHPDMPFLKEVAWIYFPYSDFKKNGGLATRDAKSFERVIFQVEERILRYVNNTSGIEDIDSHYDQVGGDKTVALVTNVGQFGRMAMSFDGIQSYVAYREMCPGCYHIVIGTLNSLAEVDIAKTLEILNQEETNGGKWGGGDGVGGCDRCQGTRIKPERVLEIMKSLT